MKFKLIAAAVLAALLVILLVQNSGGVALRIFFWKMEMSKILLIALLFFLGFALGFIVAKLEGKRSVSKRARPTA